jgi:hypothetical protein
VGCFAAHLERAPVTFTLDLMFEASSTLARPANSRQPLWRYLSAKRLHDLLSTGELFFAHLPILEDAFEGALTTRSREALADWYQGFDKSTRAKAYEQVAEYESAQRFFYVNCWHMNDHESYLMWRSYAHRGFAIETNFERLQAAMDASSAWVTGGVVDYVDFSRDLTPLGNVFTHIATKDLPYKDEREFRLVYWDVDPRNAIVMKVANGVRVKVDLKMLISRIVRSPFPEPVSRELGDLLDAYAPVVVSSAVPIREK